MAYANALGDCNQVQELERTIKGCTEVIESKPNDQDLLAAVHGFRGMAYAGTGKLDLAVTDFSITIAINPKDIDAYRERGAVYSALGAYDKAISDFNRMLEIDPGSDIAYYNRGHTYLTKRENHLALADFNKTLTINPQFSLAYGGRGAVYGEKGDYDRALIEFNKAIEIEPEYAIPAADGFTNLRASTTARLRTTRLSNSMRTL